MKYKRTHSRIPLSAQATLTGQDNQPIKARIVNLSVDGISVTGLPNLPEQSDYQVELRTDQADQIARFGVKLIHQDDSNAGFQITIADIISLKSIIHICYHHNMQSTN